MTLSQSQFLGGALPEDFGGPIVFVKAGIMRIQYTALSARFAASCVSCAVLLSVVWAAEAPEYPWIAAVESEGVVFFAYSSLASVERYDLASRSWLEVIEFEETPSAFAAASDALYVSFGRRTSRMARDGSNETRLPDMEGEVEELFVIGDVLGLSEGDFLTTIDRQTGILLHDVSEPHYWFPVAGFGPAPGSGIVFGVGTYGIPLDIARFTVSQEGSIGYLEDSPYHGDYPIGSRCYVFPDESKVADNSGVVYGTKDLSYAGSFAGSFSDLVFADGQPYIVRDGTIIAYSENLRRGGEYTPSHEPLKIAVDGGDIISFHRDGDRVAAEAIPLGLLVERQPGDPIDPTGLEFEPDAVAIGPTGTILLSHFDRGNVFRWSAEAHDYLPSIPLLGNPRVMAYSPANQSLYLGYPTGEITSIDLGRATPGSESPYVNTAYPAGNLACAGQYLVTDDGPDEYRRAHQTYDPDGSLIDQLDPRSQPVEFVWNGPTRRLYFMEDWPSLWWEELREDGTIASSLTSSYVAGDRLVHPVRVKPSGELVISGAGQFFDGHTLEMTDSLENAIADVVWIGEQLFTLRALGDHGELQKWGDNHGIETSRAVAGSPLRLFANDDELLVIALRDGKPGFSRWDQEFNALTIPIAVTNGLSDAYRDDQLTHTVTVSNPSDQPREGVHVQCNFPEILTSVSWTCEATTGSECSAGPLGGDVLDTAVLAADGEVVYTVTSTVWTEASGDAVVRCEAFRDRRHDLPGRRPHEDLDVAVATGEPGRSTGADEKVQKPGAVSESSLASRGSETSSPRICLWSPLIGSGGPRVSLGGHDTECLEKVGGLFNMSS